MPFTPFHLGPALLVSLPLFSYVDLPSIIVSSVIVDLEPLSVIVLRLPGPLHGFFHTYLAGTLLAMLAAILVYLLRGLLNGTLMPLNLQQKSPFVRIIYSSLAGVYSHVLLDSFLYEEMTPLYPLSVNPVLGVVSAGLVYGICALSFLLGLGLLVRRYKLRKAT